MWTRTIFRQYCKCSKELADNLFKTPSVTWANKDVITNKHVRRNLNFNYNFQYRPEEDAYTLLAQLKRQQMPDAKDDVDACPQLLPEITVNNDEESDDNLPCKTTDEKATCSELPYKTLLCAPLPKTKASYCFRSFGPVPKQKKRRYVYIVIPAAVVSLLGLICLCVEDGQC